MTNYNKFSKYYDTVMGDREEDIKCVFSLIENYVTKKDSVLDMCCGTGFFTKQLTDFKFKTGVDKSKGMLQIAKKTVKNTKFVLSDMTRYKSKNKFDLVLCLFDSINHLTKKTDWVKFFSNSYSNLNDGGWLIFDINTVTKLEKFSKLGLIEQSFPDFLLKMKINKIKSVYLWDINILGKNGKILAKEKINEISFPSDEIKRELIKKFKKILVVPVGIADKDPDRVYFICQK
jgi:SAM-dependent methyltransferase